MAPRHFLTINLNEQCPVDAGSWQECVAEGQRSSRLVSPPQTPMYRQVLSYLEELMGDQRDPPKSQLHFGELAIATVAVCLRWGSYFAALVNRDLPHWAAACNPEVSCIGDGEMARINIDASAALSDWIDLMRADQQHFRRLVKAAVRLLPFPIAQLDGSTYYHRFEALNAFHSAHARRSLMGAFAPPRPLLQRRLTRAQEALLMQETAELFVPTMRTLFAFFGKPSEETWPELALPYALAFKPPADWSLEELTREIVLPGAEPR